MYESLPPARRKHQNMINYVTLMASQVRWSAIIFSTTLVDCLWVGIHLVSVNSRCWIRHFDAQAKWLVGPVYCKYITQSVYLYIYIYCIYRVYLSYIGIISYSIQLYSYCIHFIISTFYSCSSYPIISDIRSVTFVLICMKLWWGAWTSFWCGDHHWSDDPYSGSEGFRVTTGEDCDGR